MFKESVFKCHNESSAELLANIRKCFGNSTDLVKDVMKSGHGMGADQCIAQIESKICDVFKDMTGNNAVNYAQCLPMMEKIKDMKGCIPTDSKTLGMFSSVICGNGSWLFNLIILNYLCL